MIEFDDAPPKDLITKIKYKYWEIWPACLRPMTMWYIFKCWAWYRHSTIRCRNLPHTWSDRREILLHASFQILTDFIDKECSPSHVQWYGDYPPQIEVNGVMKNAMDEMLELYWWWNIIHEKQYPEMMDNFWAVASECSPRMVYRDDEQRDAYKAVIKKIRETEELMDRKAEEMLKRLATVRLWMWT